MNPVLLIRAGIAVGALVGAAVLGRKAIDKTIEHKVTTATEDAVRLAEEELDRSVRSVLRERIIRFLRTMGWKVFFLSLVVAGYFGGLLTSAGLQFGVVSLGLGYLAYDLREGLPRFLPALRYARARGFRPKAMVTDAVSAAAFERAYEQASAKLGDKEGKHWIALSSFNPDEISNEIAEAVAEVARSTSYDKVWPRALLFFAITSILSLCYTGLAWFALQL